MAQIYCVVTTEVQFVQLSSVIPSVCVTVLYCDALLLSETFVASVGLLHCCWLVCKCMYEIGFNCTIQKCSCWLEIIITCANSAD